jgi:glycosyltransferase involved in cell wall biosynthesis
MNSVLLEGTAPSGSIPVALVTAHATDTVAPVSPIVTLDFAPHPFVDNTFTPDTHFAWTSIDEKHRQFLTVQNEGMTRVGKVLHVINGEHFSGAERVQQLLGRRLGDFGVDSHFVCLKPNRFPLLSGLDHHRVASMPMRGRMDLAIIGKLARHVIEGRFDLLHAHTPRTALITSALSLRTGLPWCYHVHSPAERDSTRSAINWINYWIEKLSLRSCDRLITVSESLKKVMLKQGVRAEKVKVVPNGVPAITPIDCRTRSKTQQWRLGLIALMRPRKGIEIALKSLAELKRMKAPVQLELIGVFETEAYQNHILKLIQDLGLQDIVTWTGFTNDIPSALHRLDALLLPSLFGEGMPMVVLEALAAGVPVVATRVEGTPEVIRDTIEGVLAEPGDVNSCVDRILYLTGDRQRWEQMSQSAVRRHRSEYSDQSMALRIARIYADILRCPASTEAMAFATMTV